MRVVLFAALLAAGAQAKDVDARSGLIIDDGWIYVAAHCGACHSYDLVTAQRGDAKFWLGTIRWMQRTQKLWAIPEDQEQALVAYLERNYNEQEWGRRPPLPPTLMPPLAAEGVD